MSRVNKTFATLRRTPYQSLAAVAITTVTFFVLCIVSLFVIGTEALLGYFESRPQVTAFFKDSSTLADVDTLKASVAQAAPIESVTYISKEEALQLYRDQNQDNPLLLEMVTADILPASLEVRSQSVDSLESIAKIMQSHPEVEEVVYQKDVADSLRKWLSGIRLTGITLSTLLLFVSTLTMIVIVGLKFRSKKAEMYTLTLLGATRWYIKAPYVREAILYGLSGAFLGWGLSYLLLLYTTPNLVGFVGDILPLPVPLWLMGLVLAGALTIGIVLGLFASLLATRRLGK